MKTDASKNASNSAINSPGSSPANEPPPALTEAELIQQEVQRARAAMSEALADLGRNLKKTADPHFLTREHPWIAISGAAVAGFAAAVALIPSKEQQALRALAELERARNAPPPAAAAPGAAAPSDNATPSTGVFGTILAEAVKTLRPVLTTLLSAGVARATNAASPSTAPTGNGHPAEEEISTPS